MPRAAALAWFVFGTRPAYSAFMALSLAVYAFCLVSTMALRRIKDIPKHVLAKVLSHPLQSARAGHPKQAVCSGHLETAGQGLSLLFLCQALHKA